MNDKPLSLQDIIESAKSAFYKHYPRPDFDPGYVNFNDLPGNYQEAWTAAVSQAIALANRLKP